MRSLLWLPLLATSACAILFPSRDAAGPAAPAPVARWKPNTDRTFVIGSRYETDREKMLVTTTVRVDTRAPGPSLPLELVVVRDGTEVQRTALDVSGDHVETITPLLRRPGRVVFQVVEASEVRETHAFDVGAVACFGGVHRWKVFSAEPGIVFSDDGGTPYLIVPRWESRDQDPGYVVEWRRDGELVKTDQGRTEKLAGLYETYVAFDEWPYYHVQEEPCLWDHDSEKYATPEDLLARPGAWEVSVYREGQPATGVRFAVDPEKHVVGQTAALFAGVQLVPLEAPPKMAQRLAAIPARRNLNPYARPLIAPTPAILRALARDEALTVEIAKLNADSAPKGGRLVFTEVPGETTAQREAWMKARQAESDREDDAESRRRRAQAMKRVPGIRARLKQKAGPWLAEEHPAAAKPED